MCTYWELVLSQNYNIDEIILNELFLAQNTETDEFNIIGIINSCQ